MFRILMNLVLVAVFRCIPDWVASELVAREYPERNVWKNSAATYMPCSASLKFVERLRARYVEHTCWADELVSVVVIAVRLRVMT